MHTGESVAASVGASRSRRLHANNALFRSLLLAEGFDLRASQRPVVPVYSPAVAPTEGRLRFIVNTTHTDAEIPETVAILTDICRDHGVR